jgi:hypothetical protein
VIEAQGMSLFVVKGVPGIESRFVPGSDTIRRWMPDAVEANPHGFKVTNLHPLGLLFG